MRPDPHEEFKIYAGVKYSPGALKAWARAIAVILTAGGTLWAAWDKISLIAGSLLAVSLLCTLSTPVLAQSSTHYCPIYVQAWALSPDPGFPPCWPGSHVTPYGSLRGVSATGGWVHARPPFFLR